MRIIPIMPIESMAPRRSISKPSTARPLSNAVLIVQPKPKTSTFSAKLQKNIRFSLRISKKSRTFAANLDKSTNFAGTGSVKKR
ncbi:MAG: hypothetical protein IJQ18_05320 [Paludibacteraceae bacterium]|nr:hypothetical protein [Paludibacteraceae bacterium]